MKRTQRKKSSDAKKSLTDLRSPDEIIKEIRSKSDTTILAFSGGKDSVGAWLELRKYFKKIIPVYMYCEPDLGFIEEGLKYYEEFFQTRILRVPHPSFYRMLRLCVFQPPERVKLIDKMDLARIDHNSIMDMVREYYKLPNTVYQATGVRAADSPMRRLAMAKGGGINHKTKTYYPICAWNKTRLLEEIKAAGVKLPKEYRVFGRSYDGIDFRFLYGLREHFPKDYGKILFWFPMAELELVRYEFYLKNHTEDEINKAVKR